MVCRLLQGPFAFSLAQARTSFHFFGYYLSMICVGQLNCASLSGSSFHQQCFIVKNYLTLQMAWNWNINLKVYPIFKLFLVWSNSMVLSLCNGHGPEPKIKYSKLRKASSCHWGKSSSVGLDSTAPAEQEAPSHLCCRKAPANQGYTVHYYHLLPGRLGTGQSMLSCVYKGCLAVLKFGTYASVQGFWVSFSTGEETQENSPRPFEHVYTV